MSSFVDGFMQKAQSLLTPKDAAAVRDLLETYVMGYNITPATTEIITGCYQIPQAFYIFMAAKEQDGKMSAASAEQYRMCITDMLQYLQMPLEKITVNHIWLYLADLNRRNGHPLAAATLNQRKSIIKSFFAWLTEEEYIEKNPSLRIKREKDNAKPREPYKDVQIEEIRAQIDNKRDMAIIDLLLSSGIRVSECTGLKRTDIDFKERSAVVYGKGGKWRTVYFNGRAEYSLKEYLKTRTDECTALFVTRRKPHKPISRGAVERCLKKYGNKAGIENLIPHGCRHTVASAAIERGMPIESVQSLLGHSRIETTMRYVHMARSKVSRDYQTYLK